MAESPDLKRRSFLFGRPASEPKPVDPFIAVISPSCFAFQGIACMTCRDACSSGAVRVELARGGVRPWIDRDGCTGCGECARSCPADAIRIGAGEEA